MEKRKAELLGGTQPTRVSKRLKAAQAAKDKLQLTVATPIADSIPQDLLGMPVDILLEIFAYVEPKDLLNLSRCTKAFRAFLLNRRSATLCWKAARKNVEDLPEIPDDMSEPAFAHMFFDGFCHHCLRGNASPHWVFLGRFCHCCLKEVTLRVEEYIAAPHNKEKYYMALPVDGRENQLLMPVPSTYVDGNRRDWRGNLTRASEWESTLKRFEELGGNKALEDAFISKEFARCDKREENAKKWRAWEKRRKAEYASQLEQIRLGRLRSVLNILRKDGWGKEVDLMGEIMEYPWHPLFEVSGVGSTQRWGPRSWPQIRADVIEFMQRRRALRLEKDRKEREKTFAARRKAMRNVLHNLSQRFGIMLPHEREFFEFSEIKALIELPPEESVAQEDFDALEDVLFDRVVAWRAKVERRLVKLFLRQTGVNVPDYATAEKLALYRAAVCKRCDNMLCPDEMFSHKCFHQMCYSVEPRDPAKYAEWIDSVVGSYRWGPRVQFAGFRVQKLLALCELDPLTTTAEELDKSNIRFCCHGCPQQKQNPKPSNLEYLSCHHICTWRWINHCHSKFRKDKVDRHLSQYAVVDPHVVEQIAAQEAVAKSIADEQDGPTRLWYCRLCVDDTYQWCWTQDKVSEHLQMAHGVDHPSEEHMTIDSSAYSTYSASCL
ncbi:hypothetical protein K474DRAFT_1710484 [Panus rudis PR-1116 ss-1]|nr:hypothetical protein K474DRAFT_1710484 [Panus rudis PR-1116 ss-1]